MNRVRYEEAEHFRVTREFLKSQSCYAEGPLGGEDGADHAE
jgi:hypothetical protein